MHTWLCKNPYTITIDIKDLGLSQCTLILALENPSRVVWGVMANLFSVSQSPAVSFPLSLEPGRTNQTESSQTSQAPNQRRNQIAISAKPPHLLLSQHALHE